MGADGFDGTLDYISEGTDLTAFNNVFWTNHYDPSDPSEATAAFVEAYEAEYGTAPMSFAALTHDCLLIVQTAIETAGTTDDIAAVRDAMADTSVVYDGVTGTFSLDATGTPTRAARSSSTTLTMPPALSRSVLKPPSPLTSSPDPPTPTLPTHRGDVSKRRLPAV